MAQMRLHGGYAELRVLAARPETLEHFVVPFVLRTVRISDLGALLQHKETAPFQGGLFIAPKMVGTGD
jgi:hypothetical protein